MPTYSSILAWRTPWTEGPGRPQSRGLHGVRHDLSDLACTHANSGDIREFEEVSGHRVLIKRAPGNRGPSERGTTHEATSGMSS